MDSIDRANELIQRTMELYRRPITPHGAPLRTHCSACGETIEPARLKVFPHALRCIDCQMEWEKNG
jgi:phage/conjugal plasmid C-4 type zinc finger TraR family protein